MWFVCLCGCMWLCWVWFVCLGICGVRVCAGCGLFAWVWLICFSVFGLFVSVSVVCQYGLRVCVLSVCVCEVCLYLYVWFVCRERLWFVILVAGGCCV